MTGRAGVLVIGHDASRTGAPIALLEVVRHLARDPGLDVRVGLLAGGPLADAYGAIAPTVVAPPPIAEAARLVESPDLAAAVPASVLEPLGRAVRRVGLRAPGRPRPDVVLAGTLASWSAAVAAARGGPVVCWVHELDGVADRLVPPARRAALLAQTSHLVAAGPRVATMLVERWGVPARSVTTVAEPVAEPVLGAGGGHADPLVVGVGAAIARKGLDAFVATAAAVHASRPEARFRWVGAAVGQIRDEAVLDVAAAGLADAVTIDGPTDHLAPVWERARVLLHSAREDADPLVVVEAARAGVAVVTWDTGGAADLLRAADLGSLVAPAGDVLGLARRVGALLDDAPLAAAAAAALARAAVDHRPEVAAARIRAVLVEAAGAAA